jgi:hypothetical protein
MAVARHVQANALHVKITSTAHSRIKMVSSTVLFGSSANDDFVQRRFSATNAPAIAPLGESTSVRIGGSGASVVARLLSLTPYQRELLERRTTSVTASEYRALEGSNALLVLDSERLAAVALHELGFARVRERGAVVSDRFYKTVDSSNGASSIAWARLERAAPAHLVYVHISLVPEA